MRYHAGVIHPRGPLCHARRSPAQRAPWLLDSRYARRKQKGADMQAIRITFAEKRQSSDTAIDTRWTIRANSARWNVPTYIFRDKQRPRVSLSPKGLQLDPQNARFT
jgi:hypothetical protein